MDFDFSCPEIFANPTPDVMPPAAAPETTAAGDVGGGSAQGGVVDGQQASQLFGYVTGGSSESYGAPVPSLSAIDGFQKRAGNVAEDNTYRDTMAAMENVLMSFTPEQLAKLPKSTLQGLAGAYNLSEEALKAGHGEGSTFTKSVIRSQMGQLQAAHRRR